ncbi:MAG TPA: hypothetical protein DCY74_03995 [Clostridiales bacterium]|nr:hypothetical protein [Clostridiales bacterium]
MAQFYCRKNYRKGNTRMENEYHTMKKTGKSSGKVLLSLFLTFIFVLGAFPGMVFAADKSAAEAVILYEKQDIRDPYFNHYVLSDGTSVAMGGTELLRFEKDGQWVDIDNRLTLQGGRYVNQAAPVQVSFAQDVTDDTLFSFGYENSVVSFSLLNEVGKTARASAPQAARSPAETRMAAEGKKPSEISSSVFEATSSSIRYENVRPGMAIEYSISGTSVSKDIILESADAWQDKIFAMDTDLKPILQEDGSILLCDEAGEPKLTILATLHV